MPAGAAAGTGASVRVNLLLLLSWSNTIAHNRLQILYTRSEEQYSYFVAVGKSWFRCERVSFEPNRYEPIPLYSGNRCDYCRWSIHLVCKGRKLPTVNNSCLRQKIRCYDRWRTSVSWAPEGSICTGWLYIWCHISYCFLSVSLCIKKKCSIICTDNIIRW